MTCLAGLAPLRGRRVSEVGLHDRAKVGRYWSPLVPHLFLHACVGVARVVSSRIGVVGSSADGGRTGRVEDLSKRRWERGENMRWGSSGHKYVSVPILFMYIYVPR